jgi:hypothetical protein
MTKILDELKKSAEKSIRDHINGNAPLSEEQNARLVLRLIKALEKCQEQRTDWQIALSETLKAINITIPDLYDEAYVAKQDKELLAILEGE